MTRINSDDVRDHLRYDYETGKFYWKQEAGTLASNGYRYIRVKGKMRLAHRLAWTIHYGEEPSGLVDHINGNRRDNRIQNLRIATFSQNGANAKRHSRNTSGLKGASKILKKGKWTGRWQASITVRNRQMNFGSFNTKEEAHAAYLAAARLYHGVFASDGISFGSAPLSAKRDWLWVASSGFGALNNG